MLLKHNVGIEHLPFVLVSQALLYAVFLVQRHEVVGEGTRSVLLEERGPCLAQNKVKWFCQHGGDDRGDRVAFVSALLCGF